MTTIVLMAGDGTRFQNSKYGERPYKPFVTVKGKTILEWTMSSVKRSGRLIFAIRSDHNDAHGVEAFLKSKWDCEVVMFEKPTRGNLETAIITCERADVDPAEPLMILDSDNLFDGSSLDGLGKLSGEIAAITYFEPLDDSAKWCFAIMDGDKVISLREKDPLALIYGGKPMVGVFYFSRAAKFWMVGAGLISEGNKVKNEFFMSQSVERVIRDGGTVLGFKVTNVHPLGTPEDVDVFASIA